MRVSGAPGASAASWSRGKPPVHIGDRAPERALLLPQHAVRGRRRVHGFQGVVPVAGDVDVGTHDDDHAGRAAGRQGHWSPPSGRRSRGRASDRAATRDQVVPECHHLEIRADRRWDAAGSASRPRQRAAAVVAGTTRSAAARRPWRVRRALPGGEPAGLAVRGQPDHHQGGAPRVARGGPGDRRAWSGSPARARPGDPAAGRRAVQPVRVGPVRGPEPAQRGAPVRDRRLRDRADRAGGCPGRGMAQTLVRGDRFVFRADFSASGYNLGRRLRGRSDQGRSRCR